MQTCTGHLTRAAMRFVNYKDRKKAKESPVEWWGLRTGVVA